jgi:hypothetical protein
VQAAASAKRSSRSTVVSRTGADRLRQFAEAVRGGVAVDGCRPHELLSGVFAARNDEKVRIIIAAALPSTVAAALAALDAVVVVDEAFLVSAEVFQVAVERDCCVRASARLRSLLHAEPDAGRRFVSVGDCMQQEPPAGQPTIAAPHFLRLFDAAAAHFRLDVNYRLIAAGPLDDLCRRVRAVPVALASQTSFLASVNAALSARQCLDPTANFLSADVANLYMALVTSKPSAAASPNRPARVADAIDKLKQHCGAIIVGTHTVRNEFRKLQLERLGITDTAVFATTVKSAVAVPSSGSFNVTVLAAMKALSNEVSSGVNSERGNPVPSAVSVSVGQTVTFLAATSQQSRDLSSRRGLVMKIARSGGSATGVAVLLLPCGDGGVRVVDVQ